MARPLHVRLRDGSQAALEIACEHVRRVAADERDREEMRLIREHLSEFTPPPVD